MFSTQRLAPSRQPAYCSSALPNEAVVELLIQSCPAGLFSRTQEGKLHIDYRGCLECGTCRLLCDEATLQEWRYPDSGFGITFRFG